MKNILLALIFFVSLLSCRSSELDSSTNTVTIRYSIPEQSYVKLTILNSYDTVIETVEYETQSPGLHTEEFDFTNLKDGHYFYSLYAKGLTSLKVHQETKLVIIL